ncbi:DUF397 domain-containing protein [Streptomyces sp. N2-109]|uniref:DUF397 domain-containing protein n=1 Tax=Streptomyces gossypii TaxID=2883101 RepID=A0ABT2JSL3_9ACTN|nr:DUF397 domain-containing protein [Streptomyces gossypii]MCT2590878.1 DUF397 domain-containing protein [Streptomyces gossypii]
MLAAVRGDVAWRKSSYSGTGGDCLEISDVGGEIAVRDSKRVDAPALAFPAGAWRAFVAEAKVGR